MSTRYQIVRFYQDDRPSETIATGLTLDEAQAHCCREDTHGEGWFDGYDVARRPIWDRDDEEPTDDSWIEAAYEDDRCWG